MSNVLDTLLAKIDDPALRAAIADEVERLRDTKQFGLVFERHLPETVELPNHPVRRGSQVQRRSPGDPTSGIVTAISGGKATVAWGGGETEEVASDELIVVARFGEPIYPGLKSLGRIERGGEKPFHTVISGENYHALQLLQFTYQGRVDVIYIDPPYNTGARDWKYNNRYVDETDEWGHSKWLSFMEKRLKLGKGLLKPDSGVLIVTIDEHEVHHLGMLLESVFPAHHIHMITIVHNPKGTYKKNFARVDEYAFFVVPKSEDDVISELPAGMFDQATSPEKLEEETEDAHEDYYLRRRGQESGFRHQRPNQFYAILVDEKERKVVGVGPQLDAKEDYEVTQEDGIVTVLPARHAQRRKGLALQPRNNAAVHRRRRDRNHGQEQPHRSGLGTQPPRSKESNQEN